MIYVLAVTIFILFAVIVYQVALFRKSRRVHEQKMDVLRQVIVQLAESNSEREQQVRISDELMQKLRSANVAISQDISGLVTEFVQTLQANNLLR